MKDEFEKNERRKNGEVNQIMSRIRKEKVDEIRKLASEDYSDVEISEKLGVSRDTIRKYRKQDESKKEAAGGISKSVKSFIDHATTFGSGFYEECAKNNPDVQDRYCDRFEFREIDSISIDDLRRIHQDLLVIENSDGETKYRPKVPPIFCYLCEMFLDPAEEALEIAEVALKNANNLLSLTLSNNDDLKTIHTMGESKRSTCKNFQNQICILLIIDGEYKTPKPTMCAACQYFIARINNQGLK
jgi:hypothetical protein